MKENANFIITFSLMMATILFLYGCEMMEARDTASLDISIEMINTDEECRLIFDAGSAAVKADSGKKVSPPN